MKQLPFADYNDGKLDLSIITNGEQAKMIISSETAKWFICRMKQVKTFQAKSIHMHMPCHCM